MLVKICGITNLDDAQAAVDEGADALGFIFHPPSPRYIDPAMLVRWIDRVSPHVLRVGVFVDQTLAQIETVARTLALDVIQLHGSERPLEVPAGARIWKAFRVDSSLPPDIHAYGAEAVVLDGVSSGRQFPWHLARNAHPRIILAGGLNENNVADAIAEAEPWGVDACSSIESQPGRKDRARLARFLKACQTAAANVH